MLEFACPKCSKTIKAAGDQVGEVILCPKCEQKVKIPGQGRQQSKATQEEWSVFDEGEKFIEESVTKKPDAQYKAPEDDREPLIDTDDEAIKQEEQEEKRAAAEARIRAKSFESQVGPSVSSGMTTEEKMAEEARFKELVDKLPPGSLPKQEGWVRDQGDPQEPIPLDNIPRGNIRAVCYVCDSVALVGPEKAGTQIACSDCGSSITVPSAQESMVAEKRKKQDWENWTQQERPQAEKKTPSDAGFFVAAGDEDEGYGLAPPADDLLAPPPGIFPEGEESTESEHVAKSTAEPSAKIPAPEDKLQTSKLFEEMQAEKENRFQLLPFSSHVLGVLSDPGFMIRVMISTGIMLAGFSVFHFSKWFTGQDAIVMVYLGKFIQLWAYPFIPISVLAICWIGQQTLNATIMGAKKLPELTSVSLIELVSNCMFVVVGVVIAAAPGGVLGLLIWTQFKEWEGFWLVPAGGTFTAMVFAPVMVLSAMHNRSPFQVSSREIMDSFRSKSEWWIEFYCFAGWIALQTSALWLLGMTEWWLVAVFMLAGVNLGFGIYFRMLGRLMGCIVNQVKNRSEGEQTQESARFKE